MATIVKLYPYSAQIAALRALIAGLPAVASSGSYDDLTDKPTLGTAAAADTGDFAPVALVPRVDAVEGGLSGAVESIGELETGLEDIGAVMAEAALFETTDMLASIVLDQAGRRVSETPTVEGVEAMVEAGTTPVTIYETTDMLASIVLDQAGHRVSETPTVEGVEAMVEAGTTPVAIYETTDINVATHTLDESGRVISTAVSQAAIDAALSAVDPDGLADVVAEITEARGNTASLSARVAAIVTPDGAPIVDRYGRDTLRQTHMLLTKLSLPAPEACQLIENIGGDSFSHRPDRWTGAYAAVMAALYGDAGGGWCGFGFLQSGNVAPWTVANQPTFRQGNVRPATYPTIHIGAGVGTYYTALSPDLALVTLGTSGDAVYQAFPALPVHNGCDLFFVGTADGEVEYSWGEYVSGPVDNPSSYSFASGTSLDVQGTLGALQIEDIADGMPSGAGMLRVARTAGSAKLCGVNLISDVPGVRVNKLAATGSNIGQWANAPAGWETGLAALGANAWKYMDGTNSQALGMAASVWGDRQETIVNRVRAASPGIDVLIATPPENLRPDNPISMAVYATEARKRAVALECAYRDQQWKFGSPFDAAAYAHLFAGDLIHPIPETGGRLLLAGFLDMTRPF
ncbi:MAG: hypothetical protein AB7E60_02675 [Sphingobium sp.]